MRPRPVLLTALVGLTVLAGGCSANAGVAEATALALGKTASGTRLGECLGKAGYEVDPAMVAKNSTRADSDATYRVAIFDKKSAAILDVAVNTKTGDVTAWEQADLDLLNKAACHL